MTRIRFWLDQKPLNVRYGYFCSHKKSHTRFGSSSADLARASKDIILYKTFIEGYFGNHSSCSAAFIRCLHFDMCRCRQFTTDIEGTAIVGHLTVVLGAFVPQRRGRCLSDTTHLLTVVASTLDYGQLVVQTRGD